MAVTIDETVIRSTVREVCEVPDAVDITDTTLNVLIDEAVSMVWNAAYWPWRVKTATVTVSSGSILFDPRPALLLSAVTEGGQGIKDWCTIHPNGSVTIDPPIGTPLPVGERAVFRYGQAMAFSEIPHDMRAAVLNWVISRVFDILDDPETGAHWAAQVANFLEAQKLTYRPVARNGRSWVMNDSVGAYGSTKNKTNWGF